jgi:hypothetical protein
MTKTAKVGNIDEDSKPSSDPDVYFDTLPEPFDFIDEWLEDMIIKQAFERIVTIEKKKKTPEYEGFLKTVYSSGFVDINGITAVRSLHTQQLRTNKFIIGDKTGTLHLLDTSRKIILDKNSLFDGHRIIDISSGSIPWVDTHLWTVAVISRGTPDIKILFHKNSESKFYHHFTIKGICPELADNGSVSADTSYLKFPWKVEISKDCQFMLVTTYGGDVHLLKLPKTIDPMKKEESAQPVATETIQTTPIPEPTISNFIKSEIDNIEHKDLKFSEIVLSSVLCKELPKNFVDPFEHKDEPMEEEPTEKDSKAKKGTKEVAKESEEEEPKEDDALGPKLQYKIGKFKKDGNQGDAGLLQRHKGPIPHAYFVRSLFWVKSGDHTSRQLKKVLITTGFVIAYQKLKIIELYQIQKCIKENIPVDYWIERLQTDFTKRKLDEKKKKENTLATLIKTAKEDIQAQQQKESQVVGDQDKKAIRPSLTFKTLFDIESSAYLDFEENAQFLAVGMVNGGTIVYDLNIGIEKWVLECHGGPVTTISFYQDRSVITGSTFGSVYINSLEEQGDDETLKFNQSNCQDENIPIAKVLATEYGIGVALDVMGNVRLYDMIRHKKMAKLQDRKPKDDLSLKLKDVEMTTAFRIFPRVCLDANNDQVILVDNSQEFAEPNEEDQPAEEIKEEDPKKKGKPPIEEEEQQEKEPEAEKIITDFDILKNNRYIYSKNEIRQTMKSASQLMEDLEEDTYFIISKSSICIYRLEDMIFSIYPHLAGIRRKGINTKELFSKEDPDKMTSAKNSKELETSNLQAPFAGDAYKSNYSKNTMKSNSSVHSGKSGGYNNIQDQGFSPGIIANFAVKQSQGDLKRSDGSLRSKGSLLNDSQHDYGVPTLELLNPELYKENIKKSKVVKDYTFESLKHIKERYSYHELRAQRAQKRSDEIQKELEAKREEEIMKKRKKRLIK